MHFCQNSFDVFVSRCKNVSQRFARFSDGKTTHDFPTVCAIVTYYPPDLGAWQMHPWRIRERRKQHRSRGGTLTRSIVDAPARRYKPNPSPLGRFHPGCSRSRLISIYIRRAPDHDVFTRDCNCAAYVYKSFVRADVVSLNHGHFVIPSWNELLLCI